MNKKYLDNYVRMLIIFIILVSAINNATTQFNFNFIRSLFNLLDKTMSLEKYFYILVGLSAVYVFLNRNTWLPFLGPNVLPSSLVPLKTNNGTVKVKVNVKPNTKVAYWATLSSKESQPDVYAAYGDYSNSGVVMSDANGVAELAINQGTGYVIPSGKYLQPHIHYRELGHNLAMMDEIKTVYY